jgi:DNA segregation ATPase FtsK/SpoIIIE, S-DNA-T family
VDVEELLRWGRSCADSGDLNGALDAYRQADGLGDAEAAIMLGETYRKLGRPQLAEAAYARAESRGHIEAPFCLGNMLSDLGNIEGAETAYRRGVAGGSQLAVFNLGLLLAHSGRLDEAKRYLVQAEANGDTDASRILGTLMEQQGDKEAAAAAYLRGAEAGDAKAAFDLGRLRYDVGDSDGARAAFQQAHELGYEDAKQILDAWDREGPEPRQSPRPDINQLVATINAMVAELATQRSNLRRSWIGASVQCQTREARVSVLASAAASLAEQFEQVCRNFGVAPELDKKQMFKTPLPTSHPDEWVQPKQGATSRSAATSWELSPVQNRAFDADIQDARKALLEVRGKRFSGSLRQAGIDAITRFKQRLNLLNEALGQVKAEVTAAEQAREQTARQARDDAARTLAPAVSGASSAMAELPASMQPWTSPKWETWTPDDVIPGLLVTLGGSLTPESDSGLGSNADFGTDVSLPWNLSLHRSWAITHNRDKRAVAHGFVRSLMLRHLASVKPGELQFCIFDPVGLGQTAGDLLDLVEYDANIIGGKVWTSAQDLNTRLTELSAHIETVIQKYLRTNYQTIDDFNDAAGEIAEPYRILVLFDCPTGVTEESLTKLKSIVENGPRCGVFTILALDGSIQPSYGVDPDRIASSMSRLNLEAGFSDNVAGYSMEFAFEPEGLPEQSDVAKRVIDLIGRGSIAHTEAPVTFDKTFDLFGSVASRGINPDLPEATTTTKVSDPKTWWKGNSTRGLFAPVGQKGARDAAILRLDSGDCSGALLVGRQGSGKSTLLHTYISGLTTLYGPEELDLYLIDFKEGVEFKAYAEEGLPHAKVIAIESDREFGLSVLESLEAEISDRGQILRGTGGRHSGMQGLREVTGQTLPRILLVFDEFQVLFARNDKVGVAAAEKLEKIIRQGRGFGIHVLLGSQSLAGLDALGSHVLPLLPVRILLPATEADARKVLRENNTEGDYLTTHGDGILNHAGGMVEANERFKGALLPENERIARLHVMREKADQAGFTRRPTVFEGNATVPLDSLDPRQFREELAATGRSPLRLRSGSPMSVGDVGDLVLSREGGVNVLAVVRGAESDGAGVEPASGPAYGLLVASVLSAAMTSAAIDVIDFMSVDDGLDTALEPLLDQGRITLRRRRAFADTLDSYAAEVNDRVDHDNYGAGTKILFLFGIHRARELDSEMGSLDVDTAMVEKLERVMRDGPEVGIYVWVLADSVAGASRRLTPRMMREAGWRIAGKMSTDDSQSLLGTGQAGDLRESQLILANDDRGVAIRVISYSMPSRGWLERLLTPTTTKNEENRWLV